MVAISFVMRKNSNRSDRMTTIDGSGSATVVVILIVFNDSATVVVILRASNAGSDIQAYLTKTSVDYVFSYTFTVF